MAESKSGSNAESYVIGNSPSLGGQRDMFDSQLVGIVSRV